MLIIISPAKTLDFDSENKKGTHTSPSFLDKSEVLINELRKYSPNDISKLMNVSSNLAELNYVRNTKWNKNLSLENVCRALFAFKGEVFRGLDVDTFSVEDIENSQNYLRILSGLYGLLRPLDLIQAYRLEMGTKLENPKGANLYKFWGNTITEKLNETLSELNKKTLINLASNEYYKSIKPKLINTKIITPIFKEEKEGKYKTIAVYAKKARGLMVRFIIQNKLKKAEDLKAFDVAGYAFSQEMSNEKEYIFIR